jgi:hypothetical protein
MFSLDFVVQPKSITDAEMARMIFFTMLGLVFWIWLQIYDLSMHKKEGLLCRVAALRQKPKDLDNGKIAYSRSGKN